MEGTGDFFAIKGPFRKRPTAMGASIIDSMEEPSTLKGDLLATNLDHLPLTGNNLSRLRYLHKSAMIHLLLDYSLNA
jgi:hypothetical protein